MNEPIDPTHALILAAFAAAESDRSKLPLIAKLAERPEIAEEVAREAEHLAAMADDDEGGAGQAPAIFL